MQLNDFEYWIDANIPSSLAKFLNERYKVNIFSFYYLGYLDTDDLSVFLNAKEKKNIIIITKEDDFINWVILKNPPPKIVWLTIGNVKNGILLEKVLNSFPDTINQLVESQNSFIELN